MNRITVPLASLILFAATTVVNAGSTTGSGVYKFDCPANGSKIIHERYRGAELAVLEVIGDGDTDLDIYVYDAAGNLIVSGTGFTDQERVFFVPPQTGNYRIVIRNLGGVYNRTRLYTN